MLRAVVPRQRHVWARCLLRSQSTNTPPPATPPQTMKLEDTAAEKSKTPPPQQPPRLPPSPSDVGASAAKSTRPPVPPPPGPPPPPPKKKRNWGRRFLLYSTLAIVLSYAGGVYYSLFNDNFHDFFTEYVPGGEEAVLYLEEREFKRRIPKRPAEPSLYPQVSGENKMQVSARSGVSARPYDEKSEKSLSGKIESKKEEPAEKKRGDKAKQEGRGKDAGKPATSQKGAKAGSESKSQTATQTTTTTQSKAETKPAAPAPAPPATKIDAINIDNANDPAVQTVAKMLNDLIAVVNADGAAGKYSSTIAKAKEDVQKLALDMATFRSDESKKAEERIHKIQSDFDEHAQDLVKRFNQEREDQIIQFRGEYEEERERLVNSYEEKLKAELDSATKLSEQRRENELLEQNHRLNEEFSKAVRDRVESERSSRLAHLEKLSADVSDLERLSKQYGEVLDANLKTQHLVVAVEAVRSALASADRPTPFIHELVALKETANNDPIIDAAIASIDPTAYQKGLPTNAQLIDRFRRVAYEVRKASLLPADAGAASHAASFALSRLLFKKEGLVAGDDAESILTRTETLLEEGNLDEAAREMNTLTGWAKVLSKDWLSDCRKVLEVKQALDVISAEARLQSLLVQ